MQETVRKIPHLGFGIALAYVSGVIGGGAEGTCTKSKANIKVSAERIRTDLRV